MAADVFVCKESGAFEYNGDMVVVNKGVTRVRAGHPMLTEHPELFEEITVHYEVERATATPGEKRSLTPPVPPPVVKNTPAPVAPSADDLDALRAAAEAAGVKVDKRWGADKLRLEISAAKAES